MARHGITHRCMIVDRDGFARFEQQVLARKADPTAHHLVQSVNVFRDKPVEDIMFLFECTCGCAYLKFTKSELFRVSLVHTFAEIEGELIEWLLMVSSAHMQTFTQVMNEDKQIQLLADSYSASTKVLH